MKHEMEHLRERCPTAGSCGRHVARRRLTLALVSLGVILPAVLAHATPPERSSKVYELGSIDVEQLDALDSESLANKLFGVRAQAVERTDARRMPGAIARADIVDQAMTMIGVPYRWGGNDPDSGLDCSGFVRYVYRKATGKLLPRQSAQISKTGSAIAKPDLHPGDLVFFNTPRGTATHVGIYVGKQKFVHAPATGSSIRVESLSANYWASRYYGARRFMG
ncbi:C40 family peptidase [Paraburkholderia sp. RL17-337-BIB-A]|uniref:C40 family peptidase n=1 Tax=Paraburkholderia sp. RL17-337-BIB-A TaxID=3031636 RepID=UPI0038BDC2D7